MGRMLYIFNRIDSFKHAGIGTVVLPCFLEPYLHGGVAGELAAADRQT